MHTVWLNQLVRKGLRQAFGGKAKAAELPDMCTPGIAGAATGRPKRA